VCTPQASTLTNVTCLLQPGDGAGLLFSLAIGGLLSAPGTDVLDYPHPPLITAVSPVASSAALNCEQHANGAEVVNCPTAGGVEIMLRGAFLYSPLTVTVSGKPCTNVRAAVGPSAICTLPPGTGLQQVLVASQYLLLSVPALVVSYAAATVTEITSPDCVSDSALSISQCPRAGGAVITIVGQNFGAGGARVLVGVALCLNVTHDPATPHNRLTCTLPPGNLRARSVLVMQGGARADASAVVPTVTYQQCRNGTFQNGPTTTECAACIAGYYSAAEVAVRKPAHANGCSHALRKQGSSECPPCAAGFYTELPQQSRCQPCAPGTRQERIGQTACLNCPLGTATPLQGQSACESCAPGSFSNVTGVPATSCRPCAPGTYSSSAGQANCTLCEAGRFGACARARARTAVTGRARSGGGN
jgi:hypothetical protein